MLVTLCDASASWAARGLRPSRHVLTMRSGRAQGLVEYGLIIALVAVLAIAGLIVFGPAVSSLLSSLGGSV
jgi:hypothetical protein